MSRKRKGRENAKSLELPSTSCGCGRDAPDFSCGWLQGRRNDHGASNRDAGRIHSDPHGDPRPGTAFHDDAAAADSDRDGNRAADDDTRAADSVPDGNTWAADPDSHGATHPGHTAWHLDTSTEDPVSHADTRTADADPGARRGRG